MLHARLPIRPPARPETHLGLIKVQAARAISTSRTVCQQQARRSRTGDIRRSSPTGGNRPGRSCEASRKPEFLERSESRINGLGRFQMYLGKRAVALATATAAAAKPEGCPRNRMAWSVWAVRNPL